MMLKDAIIAVADNMTIPFDIEFRVTIPEADIYDELYGFARWDGKTLQSLDGDSYSLEDEIIHYEVVETTKGKKMLSVIMLDETLTEDDIKAYRKEQMEKMGIPEETEVEKELYDYMTSIPEETVKNRGNRRKVDITKALRKREICKTHYGWEYYNNLHQYSKGKIHCSCPMCAAKTNVKKWRGKGPVPMGAKPVIEIHNGQKTMTYRPNCPHWGTTNERREKNFKIADIKKLDMMNAREKEYEDGFDEVENDFLEAEF